MNIVIFGATGGTGRQLVDQALLAGHTVTAFARYPNRIHREHERLRVVSGHVQEKQPVLDAIEGQDVVLSALGQVRERPSVAHILTVAATNIIEAMDTHGVRRLVLLIDAAVADPADEKSFTTRMTEPIKRIASGHVLKDAEDAADLIRLSGLDWTLVRVPRLGDGPSHGELRVGYHEPDSTPVARGDIARFMLAQLESERYVGQAPIVSY